MEPKNAAQSIIEGRETSRAQKRSSLSFTSLKKLRTLSLSSQISASSDTDPAASPVADRKGPLRKVRTLSKDKQDLARQASKSSADFTDVLSTSTRPTTPSGSNSSPGTSISGDFVVLVKSGPLQPELSRLKQRKEFLVLTTLAILKFKNRQAAVEQFPQIAAPASSAEPFSPADSVASWRESASTAETRIPLDRIVSVFKDEGTRPSFGMEVWWRNADDLFVNFTFDFTLPEERDEWLVHVQRAVKLRAKSVPDERAPTDIEADFNLILNPMGRPGVTGQSVTQADIFPVIPRRPYTRLRANSGDDKKGWRDNSSFYLAFGKTTCLLAQFSRSSTGQKVNPNLVQHGLVTLSRVNTRSADERFDLVFRLPLDKPVKLELSSRYHKSIITRLFKADMYLKPAWPLWTRRETFYLSDSQQFQLPDGEDYGGFKRTLEAFSDAYHAPPVDWKVNWKDVRYAPEFCLLPPKTSSAYSAHQLLAVFRALRFNDYFKSLSFAGIDFGALSGVFDNTNRLESTAWLSRLGKRSLTREEYDIVEHSSVLFQELVGLLLGSESVRHVNLQEVQLRTPTARSIELGDQVDPARLKRCEILSPIVFLLKSMQARCNSIVLDGNPLDPNDIIEFSDALQNQPSFLKSFSCSRCQIDELAFLELWEGIHEQRLSLEHIDVSYNHARLDAGTVSHTLYEARKLKRLNLANSIKGNLEGPLLQPWDEGENLTPWKLEEIDLSGWKINWESLNGILQYVEMDESGILRRLALNNCGITGEMATNIFCRLGAGRHVRLELNENPLEEGCTDWIDLIQGNETPTMLSLDMIQFQREATFNRLLQALASNNNIELLSMVGTGPPGRASAKTSDLLSVLFESNSTLKFLDLSGYSGKLEDGHMGWGLSGALGGLKLNKSLRQLRLQNHDIGAAEDVTELCRVLAANRGLAMFDCRYNNFNHNQLSKIVNALNFNNQIISFPLSDADRDYALQEEKRVFLKHLEQPGKPKVPTLTKASEARLESLQQWLKENWESEAKKAADIVQRNRDNLANQTLELDYECIAAWKETDLPSWLKVSASRESTRPKPTAVQTLAAETRRASSVPALPIAPLSLRNITPHSASDTNLQRLVIEEESDEEAEEIEEMVSDLTPESTHAPPSESDSNTKDEPLPGVTKVTGAPVGAKPARRASGFQDLDLEDWQLLGTDLPHSLPKHEPSVMVYRGPQEKEVSPVNVLLHSKKGFQDLDLEDWQLQGL